MSIPYLINPIFSYPAAPGGKLHTYASGGTSPLATYSDSAGAVPNTNPVTLDSDGNATVRGSGAYHFTLKDSTDTTTLWDADVYLSGDTLMSQSQIGSTLWPQTAAEVAAGVTPVNYAIASHTACGYVIPDRYGTNTTPGTTDMTTALQHAIAVAAVNGGTVLLVAKYKITSTLTLAQKVNILGIGYGSGIEANGCAALTLAFTTTFGRVVFDNFYINGTNCTTYPAITQTQTLNDANILYGLALTRLLITNFNVGVQLQTVADAIIRGNWIQNVNCGITLIGKCIVFEIHDNEVVYAAGCGSGNAYGIQLDSFNYTSGSGVVSPEGIQISHSNQLYGFNTCIKATNGNFVNILGNDLSALIYGIEFTTIQNGLNIENNDVALVGSSSAAGIIGHGLASPLSGLINIQRNNLVASSSTSAVGIQINDSGNQNQNYVQIRDNVLNGFNTNDIIVYQAALSQVTGNRCNSSGPTNSIAIGSTVIGPVFVDGNICAKSISFDATGLANGAIVRGINVISGTAEATRGTWTPTDASGAGLSFSTADGTWTRVDDEIVARFEVVYPSTANSSAAAIGGLPFTVDSTHASSRQGFFTYISIATNITPFPTAGATNFSIRAQPGGGSTVANSTLSTATIIGEVRYKAAGL